METVFVEARTLARVTMDNGTDSVQQTGRDLQIAHAVTNGLASIRDCTDQRACLLRECESQTKPQSVLALSDEQQANVYMSIQTDGVGDDAVAC